MQSVVAGGGGPLQAPVGRRCVGAVATSAAAGQVSYHSAADLLQQAGALRAAEARRRTARANRLHRRRQQKRYTGRSVWHRTTLHSRQMLISMHNDRVP